LNSSSFINIAGEKEVASFQDNLLKVLEPEARIFLIANNPKLTAVDLHTLGMDAQDVVVQFNTCMHLDLLSPLKSKHVYCFMSNHLNSSFGFSPDGRPAEKVEKLFESPDQIAFAAFAERFPDSIKGFLANEHPAVSNCLLRKNDIPGYEYPRARNASVGYLVFKAVEAACAAMAQQPHKPVYIYIVGFSGRTYALHEKVFHDFTFEQEMILRSKVFLHRSFGR
jgi:hypothetical protein